MKKTVVDADGSVRCPICRATSFRSQRTAGAKWAGGLTIGLGALIAPKRLKCNGCGAYLATGGGEQKYKNTKPTAPQKYAATSDIDLGANVVKGYGSRLAFDGERLVITFSRVLRATGCPAAVSIPLDDIASVYWMPPTIAENGQLRIYLVDDEVAQVLVTHHQRKPCERLSKDLDAAIRGRPVAETAGSGTSTVAERLSEVDALHAQGTISADEYAELRARILKDI